MKAGRQPRNPSPDGSEKLILGVKRDPATGLEGVEGYHLVVTVVWPRHASK